MKKLRVREVSGDPVFKNSSVLITKLMFKVDPPSHPPAIMPNGYYPSKQPSWEVICLSQICTLFLFFWKLFKCKFIKNKLDLLLKSHILFLKSSGVSAPTLFIFFKIVFAILGLLSCHIKSKVNL